MTALLQVDRASKLRFRSCRHKIHMSGFLQSRNVRFLLFNPSRSGPCGAARCGPLRSSDAQQTGVPTGRGRLCDRRFGALALLLLDEIQRSREPLVLDDFSLLYAVILREGRCPQLVLAVPEAQRAVLPLLDGNPLSARSPRGLGRVEDVQDPLVVQGQAL